MILKPFVTCVLTGLLICLATATVEAQGQGRGGRGFGGFGGGRDVLSLVRSEPVQKELGLSADDGAKLVKISDAYREEFGSEMRKGSDGKSFQDRTEEDNKKAFAKMGELAKTLQAKYVPQVKDVLNAEQFTRLQQIKWQSEGSRALADPELAKSLAISKEQQDKMAAVGEEYIPKFRALFTPGGDREAATAKMQELTKELNAKTVEVLTKEQQEKFTTLKGKEFDVSQLRGPGRGDRPRREPEKKEKAAESKDKSAA